MSNPYEKSHVVVAGLLAGIRQALDVAAWNFNKSYHTSTLPAPVASKTVTTNFAVGGRNFTLTATVTEH